MQLARRFCSRKRSSASQARDQIHYVASLILRSRHGVIPLELAVTVHVDCTVSSPTLARSAMASSSAQAGPSRTQPRSNIPPAPSTSGDSESTQEKDADSSKGGLDVSVLREVARTALVESLNEVSWPICSHIRANLQIQGAKTLILDPSLAGPLGLITEVVLLKVSSRPKARRPRLGPVLSDSEVLRPCIEKLNSAPSR